MAGLALKSSLVLLALSALLLSLTRWLAYDADYTGQVAAVFGAVPDCEVACFMGISPGVISMRDALTQLENHPWVGDQIVQLDDGLLWNWSGEQPSLIDARQSGIAGITRVHYLSVYTTVPQYYLQAALGEPTYHEFTGGQLQIIYRAYYPERGLHLISAARCPAQLSDILGNPTLIVWEDNLPDEDTPTDFEWEPERCASWR